ncbi:MAG TPA: hydantoinase B/oxoprolinase family protein [Bradyrhizobium sp.]|jgi:N-methylhydantoinase B
MNALSPIDPITLEVLRYRLEGIAEDMQATLIRVAFSPIVREGMDASAAIFLADGRSLAQSSSIPLHLGALIPSVRAVLDAFPCATMSAGDVYIVNDPYHGGTHLPDIAVITPVVIDGTVEMLATSMAHHQDVGGMRAGSVPTDAVEIFQEGLRLPPLRLVHAGVMDRQLFDLVRLNVRLPDVLAGDLAAQFSAGEIAAARVADLAREYGGALVLRACSALIARAEIMTRAAIRALPDGIYRYEDALDNDGVHPDRRIVIRLALKIAGEAIDLDFTGTSPQVIGPVNCVPSGTLAAAFFVLRGISDPATPTNAGCLVPLTLNLPEGSLLSPRAPAPVNARMATVKLVTNVIMGALAQAALGAIPAPNCGMSLILAFSGRDISGHPFVVSEIIAGGAGAAASSDGADTISGDIGNAMNMPAEAMEMAAPLRVRELSLRDNSGGRGQHDGGRGCCREYEALTDNIQVSHRGERFYVVPAGVAGGGSPQPSRSMVLRADGTIESLNSKAILTLQRGDRLRVETTGGAGFGYPATGDLPDRIPGPQPSVSSEAG